MPELLETAEEPRSAAHDEESEAFLLDRAPGVALWVFIAVEAVGLVFYLYAGRSRWFFHDEWRYLISRDGGDLSSLLKADGEHWTTLPVLTYRVLFNVFGINSYRPYQLISISLHLATAALLRVVMRRAGVSAWVATLVAVVFVLFGSGDENIVRAFQMTFVGALVFGLASLILATHGGPIGRRDVVALVFGLLALMCSGVGVAMVAAVAAAVLIARGWRVACLYAFPLAFLYLLWWSAYARDVTHRPVTVREMTSFSFSQVRETFSAMGHLRGVGLVLVVVTAGGLVLAWRNAGRAVVRRRAAGPAGLLFGLVVFVGLTAWSRAGNVAALAAPSRYLHVVAALVVPAVAVAVDALLRRWLLLTPVAVALLLVGVPGNLRISWDQTGQGRGERSDRAVYLAFPQIPEAAGADDWVRPDPTSASELTMGWLRDGIANGRVPVPATIAPTGSRRRAFSPFPAVERRRHAR